MTDIETLEYEIETTPLKTGGRSDWNVKDHHNSHPVAFEATEIVAKLRQFFDQLEAEAEARRDDPVAMVHALARMEALLADVRYVTSAIRDYAATSLQEAKVRRMVVEGIAAVEATTASQRTGWEHQKALAAMLKAAEVAVLDKATGELMDDETSAQVILEWFTPSWKLTAMKAAGLDPDDYSDQPKDEEGRPLREPTVRFHDNRLRR
jgi:hypothetical protein